MKPPIRRISPAAELPGPGLWVAGMTLFIFVLAAGCDPKPTLGPPPLSPGGSP